MILLIDNYDSFVHNLARYFERLGQPTQVVRNDAIDVANVRAMRPRALVLSPGPCSPTEAGVSLELVRSLYRELPIFGVCLGHQTIAAALGGRIVRAPEPVHGRTSLVHHRNRGIFEGLASPMRVCRYHSLVVAPDSLPAELEATAWTGDGVIMAIEHRELPVVGVQFHPEAILTDYGYDLLRGFLRRAGIDNAAGEPSIAQERLEQPAIEYPIPLRPVTF